MLVAKRFRVENLVQIGEQINAIRFGTLVNHDGAAYDATPVPWVASCDSDMLLLRAHLANANPLLERLRHSPDVLVTFTGVNGYISPRGLPTPHSAPTWNYVALHVHGKCELLDEHDTKQGVEKLVSAMETHRANPWQSGEMASRRAQLLRHVTAKLGQNESDVDLAAILLEREGRYDLVAQMREANRGRLSESSANQQTEGTQT